MSDTITSQQPVTFSQDTKSSFLQHLRGHPSNRRISPGEKENLIEWLTNPDKHPSSQREFSRRNYARKTFIWDHETRNLLAIDKSEPGRNKIVVVEENIADVAEAVHSRNGHAGWDATWKDVSASYHGILRSDVIYLLRRCQICLHNPSKRPKDSSRAVAEFGSEDSDIFGLLDFRELEFNDVPSYETNGENWSNR
ncbi:integrase zinc binding domain-containing protein [Aspergillus glaucus CBS 516.65]|uniref:Integrase zinc-binding domain-containing protein n=1 Tax=Aspergillus glaucus CBS 516.65 TaxID=1160497 RepID=A0A1L9VHM7_ASPGL|nr:hypothetical protein ASPGLDRAFT_1492951 [Aspergillus glaucus CBS 516.65]OJJ83429.1 hypothetical protein ASPGLDRAFT_1492951 [Aspergillus glaucus CBS 516.65]